MGAASCCVNAIAPLGSARVSLEPGESERVAIDAPLRALAVVPGDMPALAGPAVEAGDYEATVGDLTATLTMAETASATDRGSVERRGTTSSAFGPLGR